MVITAQVCSVDFESRSFGGGFLVEIAEDMNSLNAIVFVVSELKGNKNEYESGVRISVKSAP